MRLKRKEQTTTQDDLALALVRAELACAAARSMIHMPGIGIHQFKDSAASAFADVYRMTAGIAEIRKAKEEKKP